ncbi:DUF2156 domain-containing protein [Thermoproteota archaeon]
MKLRLLRLEDKSLFDRYLSKEPRSLASYAFENIFLWKSLYEIFWVEISGALCVFFQDKIGFFQFLPPIGQDASKETIEKCFEIMNSHNNNSTLSRIGNIEEKEADSYRRFGCKIAEGCCDYVCSRDELVSLGGVHYKNKRNAINSFKANYEFEYGPYVDAYRDESISLFKDWSRERKSKHNDSLYIKLLDDNFAVFKSALIHFNKLNFIARVVKIRNSIKAIALGYALGENSFVVLFEVCDLSFSGIAQYIFQEICRGVQCKDINIMDDSGLDSLKKVKLSYHPERIEKNFIASYE